jgi:hypothetical protein
MVVLVVAVVPALFIDPPGRLLACRSQGVFQELQ